MPEYVMHIELKYAFPKAEILIFAFDLLDIAHQKNWIHIFDAFGNLLVKNKFLKFASIFYLSREHGFVKVNNFICLT